MRRLYEFRRQSAAFLKVFLTSALLMVALGAFYVILSSTGSITALSYTLVALPTPVRNFFGIISALDLSEPLAYFCRMMYIPMVVSSILWLVQGAGTLNDEQASGLAELLFTQPGSRSWLFWKRYIGGFVSIIVNLGLLGGLTCLFYRFVLGITDLSYFTAIWVVFGRMLSVHLFCWNLGILFSALCASPVRASWYAFFIFLGMTLLTLIPVGHGSLSFLWSLSFIHYAIPEYALHLGMHFSANQIITMCIALPGTALPAWLMLRTREIDCDN